MPWRPIAAKAHELRFFVQKAPNFVDSPVSPKDYFLENCKAFMEGPFG
jgi:hypothetical protein